MWLMSAVKVVSSLITEREDGNIHLSANAEALSHSYLPHIGCNAASDMVG